MLGMNKQEQLSIMLVSCLWRSLSAASGTRQPEGAFLRPRSPKMSHRITALQTAITTSSGKPHSRIQLMAALGHCGRDIDTDIDPDPLGSGRIVLLQFTKCAPT